MEVHAHTHSSRRKWTHYLWEFLMLFLAVFCGFLAENQREHFVEKKRAKAYAKGFLFDLKEDRGELRRGSNQTRFFLSSIDSLVSIASRINAGGPVPGIFYYYGRFSTGFFRIDWSKATIDQVIQSGSLRYFNDKGLVQAINFYYYIQGIINAQNQLDMILKDKIVEFRNEIFLSRYYSLFSNLDPIKEEKGHEPSPMIDSLINRQLPLQEGASAKMDEFINYACDRKTKLVLILNRYYTIAEQTLDDIIEILVEMYHLDPKEYHLE